MPCYGKNRDETNRSSCTEKLQMILQMTLNFTEANLGNGYV